MSHTLRFGDEVTLWLDERLPSFVQSEGFVDIRCLLKPSPPPSPHPPSFRGAVFRLRPVASALGALDGRPAAVGGRPARRRDRTGGRRRAGAVQRALARRARSGRFLAVCARTGRSSSRAPLVGSSRPRRRRPAVDRSSSRRAASRPPPRAGEPARRASRSSCARPRRPPPAPARRAARRAQLRRRRRRPRLAAPPPRRTTPPLPPPPPPRRRSRWARWSSCGTPAAAGSSPRAPSRRRPTAPPTRCLR